MHVYGAIIFEVQYILIHDHVYMTIRMYMYVKPHDALTTLYNKLARKWTQKPSI